jgi:site-specific DNA recombinase
MTTEKKKIRVAIYIRASTDEQAKEGYGLETQKRILLNEVEKYKGEGWTTNESLLYTDEAESGASDDRPAFSKLIADAKAGKFEMVLVWKIDRFFRKLEYLLKYVQLLGEHNVQFKSATEPFDTSAVGKLVFQMMGALAEFERELILQRTMEGKMTKAKEGLYVGGSIPFGYDVNDEQILEVNDEEAKMVRKVFIWFVKEGVTVHQIQQIFNDPKKKILTKGDKRSKTNRKKNPEGFWSRKAIIDMLKREHYIGKYYYNRYTRDKKTKKEIEKPRSEWQEYHCPPIIDEKIFKRAGEILQENKQRSGGRKNNYLFTGKIFCGVEKCGLKYTGYKSAKKTKNYRCKGNGTQNSSFKCPAHNISEEILDKIVWEKVEPFFKNPQRVLEKMLADQRRPEEIEAIEMRIRHINTRIAALSKGEDTVRDLIRNGIYTAEEAANEFEIIRKEIADLQDERSVLSSRLLTEEQKQMKLLSIETITKKYQKNFKKMSYDEKRELYFEVIKKIIIKGNDVTLDVWFPEIKATKPSNTPKHRQVNSDNLCNVNGG